ncbi:MAG: diguanylate cyclase protein [Acidobacteriaceae bacterium]|nr:diguanylate cyclase protein [Acidobacteriaceae bacterium]
MIGIASNLRYLIGDVILKEAARRLSVVVRSYDSVGRYGGDKFLAVIPGCDFSNLIVVAERVRHCMSDCPIETTVGPISVTLSVGLASAAGSNPCDADSLIRMAEEALHKAKMAGRNRVEMAFIGVTAKAGR